MKTNERLVKEHEYSWKLIKQNPNKIHQLVLALGEENGGMDVLHEIVKDSRRSTKFKGIRQVFDKHCLEPEDTERYVNALDAFEKGFSRYLQTNVVIGKNSKGNKTFKPTFKRWEKHFKRWEKEHNTPKVNDNYSGLDAVFYSKPVEESNTSDMSETAELLALAIKGGAKSFKKGDVEVTF